MDECLKWIETRISSSLRPRVDELTQFTQIEDNRLALLEFLTNEDARHVFIYVQPPRTIFASLQTPCNYRGKSIIFFKKNAGVKLTRDNMDREVLYMDYSDEILLHLGVLTREIYLPLLCTGTSSTVSRGLAPASDRLMDVLHRVVGTAQSADAVNQGEVYLAMPSVEILSHAAESSSGRQSVRHVLETTVIGWSKQIEKILRHNPLAELVEEFGEHPVPLDEVELWMMRRAKLVSVQRQLENPLAVEILRTLAGFGSPFVESFGSVFKDVTESLEMTDENLMYLSTMSSLFEQLHTGSDVEKITQLFKPLVHVLYLVWLHSSYYHQKDKFRNLLWVISNSVVQRAETVVGSGTIHQQPEAERKLRDALKICASFRGVYLDYRETANQANSDNQAELERKMMEKPMLRSKKGQAAIYSTKLYGPLAYTPQFGTRRTDDDDVSFLSDKLRTDSPWPPRNAKLFDPLNAFMERCNDVLELVETIRDFRLLEDTIEIGGAGNRTLDMLVREIHEKFSAALQDFLSAVPDVFNLRPDSTFMKSFFYFRTTVKNLETRIAEVIRLGLMQCPTIGDRLRLLDVFEGISARSAVQTYIKEECDALIDSFAAEIADVQTVFMQQRESPPEHRNTPAVVSSWLWVFALRQRIQQPMRQLQRVNPRLLEGTVGWKLRASYGEVSADLDRFETELVESWQSSVTTDLINHLDEHLLTVSGECDDLLTEAGSTVDLDIRFLKFAVNLDERLLRLIRELYCLERSSLQGHGRLSDAVVSAKNQLHDIDVVHLRTMASQLETIVSKYNVVMSDTSPFSALEYALFDRTLSKISQLFRLGVTECTWRTGESADFIEIAYSLVCSELHRNLDIVQTNRRTIEQMALDWSMNRVLDVVAARDKSRSYTLAELDQQQRKLNAEFETMIIPAGLQIRKLLQQSFKAVEISEASPAWREYVSVLDDMILTGLRRTTLSSLQSFYTEITSKQQDSVGKLIPPLLAIHVELIQDEVVLSPPLDKQTITTSLQETVEQWLQGIIDRSRYLNMLADKCTYQEFIEKDEEVLFFVEAIKTLVDIGAKQCTELLSTFGSYDFLWKRHMQAEFIQFLNGEMPQWPNFDRIRQSLSHDSAPTINEETSVSRRMPSLSAMRRSADEREFLSLVRPDKVDVCLPTLTDFETELRTFKAALDKLQSLNSFYDDESVGWIRVDLLPVQSVLLAHCRLWIWTFTKYLADQVEMLMHQLYKRLEQMEPEVESITGDERDMATFMKLMRIFNEVSATQRQFEGKFPFLHRTVDLLNSFGHKLPALTQERLDSMSSRWSTLKTKVSLAKQRLSPKIQQESGSITKDLVAFVERVSSFNDNLYSSPLYLRTCSVPDAHTLLRQYCDQLNSLENDAQELFQIQELLETSIIEYTLLPRCRQELDLLEMVWRTAESIREEQMSWLGQRWTKLNTDQLRDRVARHLHSIEELAPETMPWDVVIGLHQSVIGIQAYIPILDNLSNSAMRTCHWKQLMHVARSLAVDSDTLKMMTFAQLLDLRLEDNAADVEQVVQQAISDLSIEQHLKTYEEVWLSKVFELSELLGSKLTESDEQTDRTVQQDNSAETAQNSPGSVQPSSQPAVQAASRPASQLSGSATGQLQRTHSLLSLPPWMTSVKDESSAVQIISNGQSILDELESHQMALEAMNCVTNIGSFTDDVIYWQSTLRTVEIIIKLWLDVQNKWITMHQIFSSPAELGAACAAECKLFAETDRDYRRLMRATELNNNVLQCCQRENIQTILEKMNKSLEVCWKSLSSHLESRRQMFPRFYFLSSEDLLRIICSGSDVPAATLYIGKLFENISSLDYERVVNGAEEESLFLITAVRSKLGEALVLPQAVLCTGAVESWLSRLVSVIVEALKSQLVAGLECCETALDAKQEQHADGELAEPTEEKDENERPSRPSSQPHSEDGTKKEIDDGDASIMVRRKSADSATEPKMATISSFTCSVAEMVYLATQVQFTAELNLTISDYGGGKADALKLTMQNVDKKLVKLASEMQQKPSDETCRKLEPYNVQKLASLVALTIHQRDLLEQMQQQIVGRTLSVYDPVVQSQLQYIYSKDSNSVTVECMGAVFEYGFEYLGSADREPISPTSERTFFSLTQALFSKRPALCLSESVYGTALDTIHELSRCLGKAVFSFNCSRDSTLVTLGNMLKGLASAGVLVCLCNIGNLREEVLSVVGELLRQVLTAFTGSANSLTLCGENVKVDSSGACVTVIDSSCDVIDARVPGYLPRVQSATFKLPRHLVSQFRIVGIKLPPLRLVAEMLLTSEGFKEAGVLSHKITILIETCQRLFESYSASEFSHLFAATSTSTLKCIIRRARQISHDDNAVIGHTQEQSHDDITDNLHVPSETEALILALCAVIIPQFSSHRFMDMFKLLMKNIFGSISTSLMERYQICCTTPLAIQRFTADGDHATDEVTPPLVAWNGEHGGRPEQLVSLPLWADPGCGVGDEVAAAATELGFIATPTFRHTIMQLHQLLQTHRTVVITGPALCGKTSCIKMFERSESKKTGTMFNRRTVYTGSCSLNEILGYYCEQKRQWNDGVVSSVLRDQCLQSQQKPNTRHILHLDGSLTPRLLETLEPVLCPGKSVVVLPNGERLIVPETQRVIFETDSISSLSPSAVTSIAVMCFTSGDAGWQSLIVSWLLSFSDSEREKLRALLDRYVVPTMCYIHQADIDNVSMSTKRVICQCDENIISTLCSLLDASLKSSGKELSDEALECHFNYCCLWAFGSTLDVNSRDSFSDWWRTTFAEHHRYPADGSVFDYIVYGDHYISCSSIVAPFSDPISADNFVQTVRNQSMLHVLNLLSRVAHRPVMIVGSDGCGKTSLVRQHIRSILGDTTDGVTDNNVVSVTADRLTTSRLLYGRLAEHVVWMHGNTYQPVNGKRMVFVVDDLHLSQVGEGERTQTAAEFVRQQVDVGEFCDPDDLKFRRFQLVDHIVTAGDSKMAALSPRLSQRFTLLACHSPSNDELHSVFSTMLNQHFCSPDFSVLLKTMNVARSTTLAARISSAMRSNDRTDEKRALLEYRVKQQRALRDMLSLIVRVTIEIHAKVRRMFLRTADRCHYVFTARHLAAVFRNLTVSLDAECTHNSLLLLWQHECLWTYGSHMINDVDTGRYCQTFVRSVKKNFTNEDQVQLLLSREKPVFSSLVQHSSGLVTVARNVAPSFSMGAELKTDMYKPVEDTDKLISMITHAMNERNKNEPVVRVALYKDVIDQICRLARVISSPHSAASHLFLVADGCPGRATHIAALAAHLAGFSIFKTQCTMPAVSSGFDSQLEAFRADLFKLHVSAGVKNKKLLFVIQEEELHNEDVLVYLAEFIQTGCVWNLFTFDQQTTIINSIRSDVTQAGLTYTRDTAWTYFLETVKRNVRICFVASDTGRKFRRRCFQYKSFMKNVNIMWLAHWSKRQLVSCATHQLQAVHWMSAIERENVAYLLATMHLVLRHHDRHRYKTQPHRHLTNLAFEKFVERFVSLANSRHTDIHRLHDAMLRTMEAVNAEEAVADKLRRDLDHEKVVLDERTAATVNMLSQIGQDTTTASQQLKSVKAQTEKIKKMKSLLPEYEEAHERAVYKTVSIVADTKKIIQNMNLESLSELRSMQNPPREVEELLAAIIIILKGQQADATWAKGAKRQMANLERFIEELLSFDEHGPPSESTLEHLETNYTQKSLLDAAHIRQVSENAACESLCNWVRGVCRYHRMMLSKVKPIYAKLQKLNSELDGAQHKMKSLENKRQALEMRLIDLTKAFEEATVDKMEQCKKTEEMEKNLEAAGQLRLSLVQQKVIMSGVIESLSSREEAISGCVAIAAAFSTYLGPYDHVFRCEMLTAYWPGCLRERGIFLQFDNVHPVYGRVFDYEMNLRAFTPPAPTTDDIYDDVYDEQQAETTDEQQNINLRDRLEENEDQLDSAEREAAEEEQSELIDDADRSSVSSLDGSSQFGGSAAGANGSTPYLGASHYGLYIRSIVRLLVGEQLLLKWINNDFSLQMMENAAILLTSWQRAPLLVDMAGEGATLLKMIVDEGHQMYKGKLKFLDFSKRSTDGSLIIEIERCILAGSTLVVYNCDGAIDGLLLPLIDFCCSDTSPPADDQMQKGAGAQKVVKFNGRHLHCHASFRLILSATSYLSVVSPLIASCSTLIDFTPSCHTITSRLLRRAIACLEPELYSRKHRLLAFIRSSDAALSTRMESQLRVGCHDNRDVVHRDAEKSNIAAIVEISSSATQIAERSNKAESALADIELVEYRLYPVARRAAMLFAAARSLAAVQSEYQFALHFIVRLYDAALGGSLPSDFVDHFRADLDPYDSVSSECASTNVNSDKTDADGLTADEELFKFPAIDRLSDENIKQLVYKVTATVYKHTVLSLSEEHRLLFSTLCAINICQDANSCTDKEIFWLLSDDAIVRSNTNKATATEVNSSSSPDWLPFARWQHLLAMSASIGSSMMTDLCAQISQNEGKNWSKWYSSEHPEKEELPALVPVPDNEGDDNEAKNLAPTDFMKLLVVRVMRPDRFHFAATDFVTGKLAASVEEIGNVEFETVLQTVRQTCRGFLVLLPSELDDTAPPSQNINVVESVQKLAQINAVTVKQLTALNFVTSTPSTELSSMSDDENCWYIIENIHHMPLAVLLNLESQLQSSKDASKSLVWLTVRPNGKLPPGITKCLHPLSLDCLQSLADQLPLRPCQHDGTLANAFAAQFKSVDHETWTKTSDLSRQQKLAIFVVGIITAVLGSRQTYSCRGLSRFYSLDGASVLQPFISSLVSSVAPHDDATIQHLIKFLAQAAFYNVVSSDLDRGFVQSLLTEAFKCLSNSDSNKLTIGLVSVPLPPPEIELVDCASWLCRELTDVNVTGCLSLPSDVNKVRNSQRSLSFIRDLERIYASQASSGCNSGAFNSDSKNREMLAMRAVLHHIIRKLPRQLPVESVSVSTTTKTCRSRATSAVEPKDDMIFLVLTEECWQLSALLHRIDSDVDVLRSCLLLGWDSLPSQLVDTANSLCADRVPHNWIPSCQQPSVQSVSAWISDLQRRHEQLSVWIKDGFLSPASCVKMPNCVWLGGLFNPQALLTAVLHKRASATGCSIDKVELQCEEVKPDKPSRDGSLQLSGLVLQGALWSSDCTITTTDKHDVSALPELTVWPALTSEISTSFSRWQMDCPMFANESRQQRVGHLPVNVDDYINEIEKSDAVILLSKDLSADQTESGVRLVTGRRRRKFVKPYFGDDAYFESVEEMLKRRDEQQQQQKQQEHLDDDHRSVPSTPSQLSYKRSAAPVTSTLPPELRLTRGSPSLGPTEVEDPQQPPVDDSASKKLTNSPRMQPETDEGSRSVANSPRKSDDDQKQSKERGTKLESGEEDNSAITRRESDVSPNELEELGSEEKSDKPTVPKLNEDPPQVADDKSSARESKTETGSENVNSTEKNLTPQASIESIPTAVQMAAEKPVEEKPKTQKQDDRDETAAAADDGDVDDDDDDDFETDDDDYDEFDD